MLSQFPLPLMLAVAAVFLVLLSAGLFRRNGLCLVGAAFVLVTSGGFAVSTLLFA